MHLSNVNLRLDVCKNRYSTSKILAVIRAISTAVNLVRTLERRLGEMKCTRHTQKPHSIFHQISQKWQLNRYGNSQAHIIAKAFIKSASTDQISRLKRDIRINSNWPFPSTSCNFSSRVVHFLTRLQLSFVQSK